MGSMDRERGHDVSVEVRDNAEAARYEIREGGQLAGFVAYRLNNGRITLVHTEVAPAYAGRGLATQLARAALDDARTRGLTVVPRCSHIADFIRKHADEYLALVLPSLQESVMRGDGHP